MRLDHTPALLSHQRRCHADNALLGSSKLNSQHQLGRPKTQSPPTLGSLPSPVYGHFSKFQIYAIQVHGINEASTLVFLFLLSFSHSPHQITHCVLVTPYLKFLSSQILPPLQLLSYYSTPVSPHAALSQ